MDKRRTQVSLFHAQRVTSAIEHGKRSAWIFLKDISAIPVTNMRILPTVKIKVGFSKGDSPKQSPHREGLLRRNERSSQCMKENILSDMDTEITALEG